MHRRVDGVVRRLRHVHVIVRVHRMLRPERCTGDSQHRFETTSFTFMLNCVPLPVIQTWSGNMSWCRPSRISSHVVTMSLVCSSFRRLPAWFASAAAFFSTAYAPM